MVKAGHERFPHLRRCGEDVEVSAEVGRDVTDQDRLRLDVDCVPGVRVACGRTRGCAGYDGPNFEHFEVEGDVPLPSVEVALIAQGVNVHFEGLAGGV